MRLLFAALAFAAVAVACSNVPRRTPPSASSTYAPAFTPLPAASARWTPPNGDPAPIGNQNGVCIAGNGNGNIIIGLPCAATPTPSPPPSPTPTPGAPTPPPLRPHQAWLGEETAEGIYSNHNATLAQLAQYAMNCEGYKSNGTAALQPDNCPGPGYWGLANGGSMYLEAGMGLPNSSGHDVDIPFGSYANATGHTCNAAAKASSGNFWNQQTAVTLNGNNYTLPDYTSTGSNNWFIYTNGGTTGQAASMGAGYGYGGSNYIFYLNMNSASLLAYVNDVLDNCRYSTTYDPWDSYGMLFQDNAYAGFQSGTWDKWDRYPEGKNFGTGSTTSVCSSSSGYADPSFGSSGGLFVPANFFNAACHIRSTLITSNDTPLQYPVDTSYRSAQDSFLGGLVHFNGSGFAVEYNGFLNTDQAFNDNTNTRFPIAEELLIGCFGTCPNPQALPYNGPTQQQIHDALGTDLGMHSAINNLASLYQQVVKPAVNTQISGMFLADQTPYLVNSTGTTALGTGLFEQNLLWEYAPMFLMYSDDAPDMTSEFSNMCGGSSNTALAGSNCMDVWPFDFVMPSGRLTAMPTDTSGASPTFTQPCGEYSGYHYEGTNTPCAVGGSYDTHILADGTTAGLYRAEYAHLWVFKVTGAGNCTAYDERQWSNCALDLGGTCAIVNGSGSSVTVTSANVNTWCPNTHGTLSNVLMPCAPTSSAWGTGAGSPVYAMPQNGTLGYGTAQICGTGTGNDVPSGGTWDASKPLADITGNSQILYDGQALYITSSAGGTVGGGNVALYDGCTIGVSGDPYNQDITNASIDPNSATIIAGLPNNTISNGAGGFEDVNTATNATGTLTINTQSGGHSPPFWNVSSEPWVSTYFIGTTFDKHAMVLNTDNCKEYEGYDTTYSAGTLRAYSGGMWDFTLPYSSSTPPFGTTGTAMASDLCIFCGMIKWNGEVGAPTPAINHALNFGFPTGQGVSQWGIVYPAEGPTGIACTGSCTHPLHYGDHLRLHASFTCPTNAQALAVCNALKHYGMYFADGGSAALYFSDADNAGGTSPYDSAIYTFLNGVHITDFDVLTESAVNCQPGHAGCT